VPGLKKNLIALAGTCCFMSPVYAAGIDLSYGPDDRLYAYPIAGGGVPQGLDTIVVHNVGVFSQPDQGITLNKVRFDAMAGNQMVGSVQVNADKIEKSVASWAKRQANGQLKAYEPLLQVAKVVAGRTLASSSKFDPGTGTIIARTPMLINSSVDHILVTAEGVAQDGSSVSNSMRIPVVRHTSDISYGFPLCGRWMLAIGPDFHGHHRWGAVQEFAIDVGRLGPDMLTYKGDGSRPDMYYSFGAPVMAIADGEVVAAEGRFPETDNLRSHPGETPEAFQERLEKLQETLLAQGFNRVIGNYVVIRHANGEHSLYAHLKANSVRVKAGQKISKGSIIGQLGHSGNSTEPHLHFSIQNGPDPITSRSLPFKFDSIRFWDEADGDSGVLNGGQIIASSCAK